MDGPVIVISNLGESPAGAVAGQPLLSVARMSLVAVDKPELGLPLVTLGQRVEVAGPANRDRATDTAKLDDDRHASAVVAQAHFLAIQIAQGKVRGHFPHT
jgi:hypothetical protein